MDESILKVRVELEADGLQRVLCPEVGWWCDLPEAGMWLGPGSRIGTLVRLNRRFTLVLPDASAGGIAELLPPTRGAFVEYGQVLFRLAVAPDVGQPSSRAAGRAKAAGAPDLPPGALAVVAPTDGVFYSRPSPDASPFVERGACIRRGDTVGLVEVMKTFNQIANDGPGWPENAEVLELRVQDGDEIRAGQILVVVRGSSG